MYRGTEGPRELKSKKRIEKIIGIRDDIRSQYSIYVFKYSSSFVFSYKHTSQSLPK